MKTDLIKISTKNMSHDAWLAHRCNSVGGSDAATIIGLNPWASPYSLWAEKTGRLPTKEDNEAMRQGRDLESYVAKRWEEATGKRVRRYNAILKNKQYPFAHANIDRAVVVENAGLECKTASVMRLKEFKGGAYPAAYYAQCVHYMAVTGAERWYLAVLVLNQGFYHFVVERDEKEIEALMSAEKEFWNHVQMDESPLVDGSVATTEALSVVYGESSDGCVDLFHRETMLKEYKLLQEKQLELARQLRGIRHTLMIDLGALEEGRCGEFMVTWRQHKRVTLSKERLRKVYPKLDLSQVMSAKNTRVFRMKELFVEDL